MKKSKASDIALKIENVSKSFRLPTEKASGIKQAFINRMRGVKGYTKQQVLKDISFEVKKGDFFGIVGRNGSGKSTLLKLISQIYTPDSGKITVNGSLVPFIELGVGFNPELTGRENVYLNGAMLGFSKSEIDAMYDEIVEFAELHEFMDQKLKNYSSGMQVRLAFSVAIKAQGDILVLDEVLAVGDEAFQRKCENFFSQIKKDKSKTVILVTHSMDSVRKYCNRAIMIREGRLVMSGSPDDVANQYTRDNFLVENVEDSNGVDKQYPIGLSDIVPMFDITPISPMAIKGDSCRFKIRLTYMGSDPIFVEIRISDKTSSGLIYLDRYKIVSNPSEHTLEYDFPVSIYNNIGIVVRGSIRRDDKTKELIAFTNDSNSCYFKITDKENKAVGIIRPGDNTRGEWREL